MSILGLLSIASVLASLPLSWWENKCRMLGFLEKPVFWRSPLNRLGYWALDLLLGYGGVAGIWVSYGTRVGLSVLALLVFVNRALFKHYYRLQVWREAGGYYVFLRKQAVEKGEPVNESKLRALAQSEAVELVRERLRGGKW